MEGRSDHVEPVGHPPPDPSPLMCLPAELEGAAHVLTYLHISGYHVIQGGRSERWRRCRPDWCWGRGDVGRGGRGHRCCIAFLGCQQAADVVQDQLCGEEVPFVALLPQGCLRLSPERCLRSE